MPFNPCVHELLPHWRRGVEDFNQHRYFEAHHGWEQGWKDLPRPLKDYLQALIQACGVFVHLRKGRLGPALSLSRSAQRKLEAGPEHAPIEIPGLLEILREIESQLACGKVTEGEPPWARIFALRASIPLLEKKCPI